MRVALLCDIHANLPALDAVLEEVREAGVEEVIVGGDILPGPMPGETLARLLDLEIPVQIVHGNGELAILAQLAASDLADVEYWDDLRGTTTATAPGGPALDCWASRRVRGCDRKLAQVAHPRRGRAGPGAVLPRCAAR